MPNTIIPRDKEHPITHPAVLSSSTHTFFVAHQQRKMGSWHRNVSSQSMTSKLKLSSSSSPSLTTGCEPRRSLLGWQQYHRMQSFARYTNYVQTFLVPSTVHVGGANGMFRALPRKEIVERLCRFVCRAQEMVIPEWLHCFSGHTRTAHWHTVLQGAFLFISQAEIEVDMVT